MGLRKTTLINAVVFSQKSVADIFSFPSLSLHIIAPTRRWHGCADLMSNSDNTKGVAFKTLELLLSEHPDFNIPKWNRLFDLYYSSTNREAVEYVI